VVSPYPGDPSGRTGSFFEIGLRKMNGWRCRIAPPLFVVS